MAEDRGKKGSDKPFPTLEEVKVPRDGFRGQLNCEPTQGQVGDEVAVKGKDLASQSQFYLAWKVYEAKWKVEKNSDGVPWRCFQGLDFSSNYEVICKVETNDKGRFSTSFSLPSNYGGMRNLDLIKDGERVNRVGLRIDPKFSLDAPSEGPPGTPLVINGSGLPLPIPNSTENSLYHVFYDNKYTGLISPVVERGTTHVEVPALGRVGSHLVDIRQSMFANGPAYLQTHLGILTSRGTGDLAWRFDVIEGEPVLPGPVEEQASSPIYRQIDVKNYESGPFLVAHEEAVVVGEDIHLRGGGFEPGTEIRLKWPELTGDNLKDPGFREHNGVEVTVTADKRGRLERTINPWSDTIQGGTHPIHALVDGEIVATTFTNVLPRPEKLAPGRSVEFGAELSIKGRGLGWSEFTKEVLTVYDNSYIGYACGGNVPGHMDIRFKVTGRSGWHFIDLYPTIGKHFRFAREAFEVPFIYRLPFLNWQSHPFGFHYRYAFQIEGK